MKNTRFLLTALAAALMPAICIASHISITIDAASTYTSNNISLNVTIKNTGNEQAIGLQVKAFFGSYSAQSERIEALETNAARHIRMDLGQAPEMPGIFRIPIKVSYEDINGYPFTAISTATLITGDTDDLSDKLTAKLTRARISTSGEIELQLSGKTKEAVTASITIVCPDEISFELPESSVILKPGTPHTIRIRVNNRTALEGSTYPVTAIIDYQDKSFHRSSTAGTQITITSHASHGKLKVIATTSIIGLLVIFIAFQLKQNRNRPVKNHGSDSNEFKLEHRFDAICTVFVLLAILGFTFSHIPPKYLLMDTTTTGGDTIAHNYLASHLADQLFNHGRIVSWAGGWWCGFPMFQYYFHLPYLLIALLSLLIPFNIAFKLASVLGILALPSCAYLSGRLMKIPAPAPALLAIASVPFLFTSSNTMWGGNIYSTFAGMIANSLSFPLMLLFIASSWRDADDGQFRLRTVIILTLIFASHFFTSVMGLLCISIIPFLKPKAGMLKAIIVIASEFSLAFLLMAWWIIPLMAKREYSLEFGTNWNIPLLGTVSKHLLIPMVFLGIISLVRGILRFNAPIILFGWMFTTSILLYYFGFDHVAQVFVNVRLWPFAFFALLALCATGIGIIFSRLLHKHLAVIAILIAVLTYGIDKPNNVKSWAKWNFEGAENKPNWPAFKKLLDPLKGTPGRLANDLHENNNSFGSSRIFESVPHLTGKPILEGGIVNSALGSMFSYYIQGETSQSCAGFPNIVSPASFNFENANKHLNLFNVKHFIARSTKTKAAFSQSSDWRLIVESKGWELYESLINDGSYIRALRNEPVGVRLTPGGKDNWKRAGLEWLYTISLIDQTFVFLRDDQPVDKQLTAIISEKDFLEHCRGVRDGTRQVQESRRISDNEIRIIEDEISDNRIKFRTTGIGLPHLVKVTYFPNWKVKGAKHVYMATPCFMLVFPEQEEVELYYGYTSSDKTGMALSMLGFLSFILLALRTIRIPRHREEHKEA